MQRSFSELGYATIRRRLGVVVFLGRSTPLQRGWRCWCRFNRTTVNAERRGHPPMGIERMLPMPIAQQCFGLSDKGAEDALFDCQAIRGIVGIELNRDAVLEATTLPKFRHLLDEPKLTERIFAAINVHRGIKGLMLKEGKLIAIEKGDLRNIWRGTDAETAVSLTCIGNVLLVD